MFRVVGAGFTSPLAVPLYVAEGKSVFRSFAPPTPPPVPPSPLRSVYGGAVRLSSRLPTVVARGSASAARLPAVARCFCMGRGSRCSTPPPASLLHAGAKRRRAGSCICPHLLSAGSPRTPRPPAFGVRLPPLLPLPPSPSYANAPLGSVRSLPLRLAPLC